MPPLPELDEINQFDDFLTERAELLSQKATKYLAKLETS
jgi:hypothetical protein